MSSTSAHQMLDDDAPEDANGSNEEDLRTEIVLKERVRPKAEDDSHKVPVSARNIGALFLVKNPDWISRACGAAARFYWWIPILLIYLQWPETAGSSRGAAVGVCVHSSAWETSAVSLHRRSGGLLGLRWVVDWACAPAV